ncbi:MAG: hypothetical protein L7F78_12165 [Syntrophales bacterium LBB04]|nr:hypothetical protein [Syntrophales bacterium LBB04]
MSKANVIAAAQAGVTQEKPANILGKLPGPSRSSRKSPRSIGSTRTWIRPIRPWKGREKTEQRTREPTSNCAGKSFNGRRSRKR